MSLPEIIAIAIPIGIIALVWLPFESAILKVFKMGGSPRNKGGSQKTLTKEYSTDRIDSNLKTGEKKVELKPALQKTQSVVKDNKDIEPDTEKEEHMIEEEFYELAYKEIESGNLKKGLWAKAFSETEGDENKTKALYIKYRFEQIKESHKEIDEKEEEVEIDSNLIPEKKVKEHSRLKEKNEVLPEEQRKENVKESVSVTKKDKDDEITNQNRKTCYYCAKPNAEKTFFVDGLLEWFCTVDCHTNLGNSGVKEDINKRQGEAYINLHKKNNYWE